MTLTMEATNFRRDEDSRSARNEDRYSISPTRTKEEKLRRRQEWMRQQERERKHEKLKQQKILEYERQRALKLAKRYSTRHSQDRRDSKSPPSHFQHKEGSTSNASNTLYEKSDGSSIGEPLFKGPQDIQISTRELSRYKVNIRTNIRAKGTISELQRDIVHPEDVILKRRKGEGCKPIFDRHEIKNAVKKHTTEATNREHYKETVSTSKDQLSQTSESSLKE